MDNLEALQNLDILLNYYRKGDPTNHDGLNQEWKRMRMSFKPSFEVYLEKLREDQMVLDDGGRTVLSFKGLTFEGYVAKYGKGAELQRQSEKNQEDIRKLNRQVTIATWIAAVSTALILVFEVLMYFFPQPFIFIKSFL